MLKRNIKIICRFNEQEFKNLKKAVRKSGLSQEAYIRSLINSCEQKARPPFDYGSITPKLNAIGKSFNRIAARANATGFFLADEYDRHWKEFTNVTAAILATVTAPAEEQETNESEGTEL